MRIVISGVAGFVGSHLAELLLEDDDNQVVGVDNFSTGREEHLAALRDHPRFSLIRHDVTQPLTIDGAVDHVYHLASPASPTAYEKMRIATLRVNSQGTWNLLDLAVDKGARFLVASTSEIYGDPLVHPQREDYWGNVNPIGLRSMYEEAKRFSEACVMAYHRERGADTRIIRIFNTYGPRMGLENGRVVTNFVMQALRNEPLTVFGDGTQTRCLCYISDLVRGAQAAMEADFHEPINIGNPEEVTIVQLARDVLTLIPESKSKIIFQPSPAYDPRLRQPDLARARQILNWRPTVDRMRGLEQVIHYGRAALGN